MRFHEDGSSLPKLLRYVNLQNFNRLRLKYHSVSTVSPDKTKRSERPYLTEKGRCAFGRAQLDLAKYKNSVYKQKTVLM